MTYSKDIQIGEICTIISKTEIDGFKFHNPFREWDGFALFVSGNGIYIAPDKKTYSICEGSFVPFWNGDSYTFQVDGLCQYIASAFNITVKDSPFDVSLPRVHNCTISEIEAIKTIHDMWNEKDRDYITHCRIMLTQLYLSLYNGMEANASKHDAICRKIIEYIVINFNQKFSIQNVANYCNISPSYLRKLFKEVTGITIMEYREQLRIKKAKRLLYNGEHQIKEIASILGYSDVYHFTRNFKNATGVTPGKYKDSNIFL